MKNDVKDMDGKVPPVNDDVKDIKSRGERDL